MKEVGPLKSSEFLLLAWFTLFPPMTAPNGGSLEDTWRRALGAVTMADLESAVITQRMYEVLTLARSRLAPLRIALGTNAAIANKKIVLSQRCMIVTCTKSCAIIMSAGKFAKGRQQNILFLT